MIREDKINGVVVRSPQNAEDAEIEINFDTDNDQQSVSNGKLSATLVLQ